MPGPLHGFRIVDLTSMISGPLATMMLADQGARVIKIEPPGGDLTRRTGPHLPGATSFEDGSEIPTLAASSRARSSNVSALKRSPNPARNDRDTSCASIRL